MKKILLFVFGLFILLQVKVCANDYFDYDSTANEFYKDKAAEGSSVSDYYENSPSPARRIRNYFFGHPTGFTPPIHNLPFNDYGQPYGINKSFYNNRGSYFYNSITPANAGIGVHILDD